LCAGLAGAAFTGLDEAFVVGGGMTTFAAAGIE